MLRSCILASCDKGNMNSKNNFMDFRCYRPAAVLVVDLVRHSTRPKPEIDAIQEIVADVFKNSIKRLGISDVRFNYTGDGYVCALCGDSSSRLLDFINASFPALNRRLQGYGQTLRAGADFGLLHLRLNLLTGSEEHFDLPGIRAARLESSAEPGQILCTQAVFDVFERHYPAMFQGGAKTIECKDRKLMAYQITPFDVHAVEQLLSDYLFCRLDISGPVIENRTKILIVDDDKPILDVLSIVIKKAFDFFEVVTADSGQMALEIFEPGRYAAALLDFVMPGMSGANLAETLSSLDPEVALIMMSGYYSRTTVQAFLSAGGLITLQKPLSVSDAKSTVCLVLLGGPPVAFRSKIHLISDAPEEFLFLLQEIAQSLNLILREVGDSNDMAHALLRHKAKHIVLNIVNNLVSGSELLQYMASVKNYLNTIQRLARSVSRVHSLAFEKHLNMIIHDLSRLHSNIKFSFSYDFPDKNMDTTPFGATIVLVLSELIENAVEALGGKGSIDASVALLQTNGIINIEVKNNGLPIDAEIAEKIFDEGVSSRGIGRGLGLYFVREAARRFRGDAKFRRDGDITVFQVWIYPMIG